MRPFTLQKAPDRETALRIAGTYLAGGTTLFDLMKLDVMRPDSLTEINALKDVYGAVTVTVEGVRLGALVRMAQAAAHPELRRAYPVITDSLWQAASPQLRNMASLGGNVLQRTRCNYFRDTHWQACNKRNPGSGCAAIGGVNRRLAVLGVSEHCIAHYPGDFAVALVALDAEVEIAAPDGASRVMKFEALHRLPGDTPHLETNLRPGELITGFFIPAGAWTARSVYLKLRDRTSYDFALASAAVALELAADGTIVAARIGLGGVAAKPWRSHEAEAELQGKRMDESTAQRAAQAAFAGAVTHGENAMKVELGRRTLVRALWDAQAREIP